MIDTPRHTGLSVDEKRDLLKTLLSLRSPGPTDWVPLSLGQQALWFTYQLAPQSPAYNFLYAARVTVPLDLPAFRHACDELIRRHPALQTRFRLQDRKPVQQVDPRLVLDVPLTDAAAWSEQQLLERLRQRADVPFDLERGPALRIELFQRSQSESVLLFVFHHILADLWSMDLLLQELPEIYAARRQGRPAHLPPPAASFADFLRAQLLSVHGPNGEKSWAYWQRVLSGEPPILELPTDRPRPPVQTYNGTAHTWPLPLALVSQLRVLAREIKATPYAALLAVFQVLLHRLSGQDDVLIGTTIADRGRPEWERLIGYLLNQVVFRADFAAERSFRELIECTRDRMMEALDHQSFPFGLIVKRLQPRRDASRSPIFQVMFIWDKPHLAACGLASNGAVNGSTLHLEPLLMEQRGSAFDLTLIIFEIGDRLTASFRYNSDLFDAATIARMAACFDTLLQALVTSPDAPVGEAPILPEADRQRILVDWNRTDCPYPRDVGFHQLVERQVERTPEAVALDFEGQTWSYRELNARANQLARQLQTLGVRRGDLVAICLPRGPDIIVSILATWKAVAAYLFLDPDYPARRLADMVADARPAALIASEGHPELPLPAVRLGPDEEAIRGLPDANLNLAVSPRDRAYVIYTSGSTGRPKGILLHHDGLCNLAAAAQLCFAIEPGDRVLQFASFSFDASLFNVALALPVGASLVLAPQAALLPGPDLLRFLRERGVTVAWLPPSVLAALPPEPLPALRILAPGGDSCSAEVVAAWAPGRRFFNLYGPSETTVWATVAECVADGRTPTIGRPVANTRVYVLDANLQPVPVGVTGELFIAGAGVAEGYLNHPELTAERFLPNPFDTSDGAVMYRTGDLVRWTASDELEFLGRRDHQLKIRGYRIEPEEIQEVLRNHPEVRDAAVIGRTEKQATAALDAYVVPRSRESFALPELRTYLRERLPHYMLPATITLLDALPLTVAGKIDRSRLPAPGMEPPAPRQVTAPRTEVEKRLVSIWEQVLRVSPIGIHDNFFDLGGASIQTLEVVSAAGAQDLPLSPEMLFRYQTIAELAAATPGSLPSSPEPLHDAPSLPFGRNHAALTQTRSPSRGALIESIGVYLPARSVATEEVLKQCRARLDFPLERLTGIRHRRMAGETEFSIDLAEKAVAECLARSKHAPADVDLLICCNISRYDGPNFRFTFEPTSAARLRRRFGLVNAVAFDITNACAGTFTALNIVDTFLRHGVIRRALVVSGEYITHLTRTAQLEIENFMDARMACLTLGDSGLALLLEQAPSDEVGFHEIEMYTLGKYHDLAVAKATTQPHGGAIMVTDPVKSSAVSIRQIVAHALERLRGKNWPLDTVDAVVMHQTSETTLDGAVREINRVAGQTVCHRGNTVYNIAERGNTATTSHFLAIWERMQAGEIEPGDRAVFAVSGSGQTVGTALYTFDDLPARIRVPSLPSPPLRGRGVGGEGVDFAKAETPSPPTPLPRNTGGEGRPTLPFLHHRLTRRIRIESIGTVAAPAEGPADTIALLRQAGEACLEHSARPREEIDLVIHTGVYRSEFLSEPALAAIAAGELRINHEEGAPRRTLAFDVMNGAAGTLSGCFVAGQFLAAGKFSRALLLASEVENNAVSWPENRLGLKEAASAFVLEESGGNEGFIAFGSRWFPEYGDAVLSHTAAHNDRPALFHQQDPALEQVLPECVRITVAEFLDREGVCLDNVTLVLPPQRSRSLRGTLAEALAIPAERLLLLDDEADFFTSSLAYSFAQARREGRLAAGGLVLVVEVAAGLQVVCALYTA